MSIVLIGYRGSGKTTVGRAVAGQLGYDFVDLDERIVERAGCGVAEIFRRHGEPFFRSLESACLADELAADRLVLSPGGGVVLSEANRLLIRRRAAHVVYLHAEPQVLHERLRADPATATQRPALTATDPLTEIAAVLTARLPIYRATMTTELDAARPVPRVVADVLRIVTGRS